ncbi:Protein FAM49B [Sarcoptes scabiei]|nr:Protein FAM49B [Sarcoptes scabiei]
MEEDLLTKSFFLINLNGQIESCTVVGDQYDNLYCKFLFRYGPDWAPIRTDSIRSSSSLTKIVSSKDGIEDEGNVINEDKFDKVFISQTASKRLEDHQPIFVWNLPFEATFKSTNPFGWPQIVVSVYGIDSVGNDVIRGYGWLHLPTQPGWHRLSIRLFSPQSSTLLGRILNWFVESRRPEFVDSRMVAGDEGRHLVTVQNEPESVVNLTLNILFKDFKKYGFKSKNCQCNCR